MQTSQPDVETTQVGIKPDVAFIVNSLPPYREHVHLRIARELTQIRLWTVLTHEVPAHTNWKLDPPSELRPVQFGKGENTLDQDSIAAMAKEWRKGGRIIRWLQANRIKAVLMLGYNDAGRLRIIHWCHRNSIPCFLAADSNIRSERLGAIKAVVKKLLVTRILRWCAGALPSGSGGVAYFTKYGVKNNRIFLYPLEPDYHAIRSVSQDLIETVAQQYGLDVTRNRLIFSGRLIPLKRVDLLIDAFVAASIERPSWDLVILGDGPERIDLAKRVPHGLKQRVIWIGFIANQDIVNALYHLCDALALCSNVEAWGLVINEAVAAGLAIISSDVPGASIELVRDGINGRVFPYDDVEALKSCLLDVTDSHRIQKLKQASPQILEAWQRAADPVAGLKAALRATGIIASH